MIGATAPDNHEEGDRAHTDADVAEIMEEAAAILPALRGVGVREGAAGKAPHPAGRRVDHRLLRHGSQSIRDHDP